MLSLLNEAMDATPTVLRESMMFCATSTAPSRPSDSEERFAVADLHVQEGEVQKSEYGSGDEDLDDAEAGQIAKHFFA
jgi:hypothetical protein